MPDFPDPSSDEYASEQPASLPSMGTPPPLPSPPPTSAPPAAFRTCPYAGKPPRRSRGFGCLIAAVVIGFSLLFLFSIVLFAAMAKGLFMDNEEDKGFTSDASGLVEAEVCTYETKAGDKKADVLKAIRIPLAGTIDLSGGGGGLFAGENSTELTLRSIRRATEDPAVKAILLVVDSGGGGITASDILYHSLVEFKESDPDRRIVVLMGDMACSGAYYASLPADLILAHPTTITGSIGVILSSINVHRLAESLGIVDESITSGENKSILNPMRELTDDQRALLQDTVDELHERFMSLVAFHRDLPMETVRKLADGRIYTANQAQELGLVDEIGYLKDAEEAVCSLLGDNHSVDFFQYERKSSLRDLLSSPDFWGAAAARALSNTATADPAGKTRVRSRF